VYYLDRKEGLETTGMNVNRVGKISHVAKSRIGFSVCKNASNHHPFLAPLFRAFTNIRYVCLDKFWDNYEESTSNVRYYITVLAIV
jgi:hypothetical protein